MFFTLHFTVSSRSGKTNWYCTIGIGTNVNNLQQNNYFQIINSFAKSSNGLLVYNLKSLFHLKDDKCVSKLGPNRLMIAIRPILKIFIQAYIIFDLISRAIAKRTFISHVPVSFRPKLNCQNFNMLFLRKMIFFFEVAK